MQKFKIKTILRSWKGELAVTLAISFMLCVYAPFELFFANQNEFWFRWHQILLPSMLLFLVSFILGMGLFTLFRRLDISKKNQYPMLVTALMFYFYVQGNFLVSGLPPTTGAEIIWNSFVAEQIKSYGSLILSIGIIWIIRRKLGMKRFISFMTISGLALFFLLVITLSGIFLTTEKKGYDGMLVPSEIGKFTMSNDKNMVVFILDSINGSDMYDTIRRHPELAAEFDGFTYYDDALATHQYTIYSIPLILSGQRKSDNFESPLADYITESFNNSPIIKSAEDNDFEIGLHIAHYYRTWQSRINRKIANYVSSEEINPQFIDHFSSVVTVAKMAGIRYAPWHIKSLCYDVQLYAAGAMTPYVYDGNNLVNDSNSVFYKELCKNKPFQITEKKQMKSIYLHGAHPPFYYKGDVISSETVTSYEDCLDACLHICAKYLKQLKAQGLYDNTAIAFVSDHGVNELVTDNITSNRQHVIFIAKGYGEKGEMKISKAPISTTDFASGFAKLLKGAKGDALFPYDPAAPIVRRCYLDVGDVLHEYIFEGPAYAPTSVRKTGVVYQ